MARTRVRSGVAGTSLLPGGDPGTAPVAGGRARRPFRLWFVPLLLAVMLPLLLWATLNLAVVAFAKADVGAAGAQLPAAPTASPDQSLLDAAITQVKATPCLPSGSAVAAQRGLAGATWVARRSAADSHAYYVAAANPLTQHLLGIWQVEGGQVQRLQDAHCPGIPLGPAARLAEAATLLSPHRLGADAGLRATRVL